ncbi:MAG: ferritin-like domain-containing protein [Cyanobacteriota bacterium]|nr:ferritin-like domain-containing protein [Cyanobacteriota bacterium]
MTQLYQVSGFDLPQIPKSDKLCHILSSSLSCKSLDSEIHAKYLGRFWNPEYFGLHKVKLFQNATQTQQWEIIELVNFGLLQESYFIEKAGVGYMAKMALLAETTQERMIYALFSADEVYHLAQIMRFLPQQQPMKADDTFLRFLANLVETQDKTVLLFVLQVVLEGWGLSHYRSLAKGCQDAELSQVLTSFLQDESRHHATGVTLFKKISVSPLSHRVIVETLSLFLQMIQVGPQRVVAAIERVLGHLSRQQKIRLFEELDTENHSEKRLVTLRFLMGGEGAETIVQELEERGGFQSFSASQCARTIL